jgi:hypothetical protein
VCGAADTSRLQSARMEFDWRLVAPLIVAFVLGMLLTGPGMWSEKWGHGLLDKLTGEKREPPHDP